MRASSSLSAAASRARLSASRAGVMSASAVRRGKPCNRAASAPIKTYRTPWRARTPMMRSGSNAALAAASSATARRSNEAARVGDLPNPLLRRQAENARDVRELDVPGRIVELPALGEERLVVEQRRPVGEARVVGLETRDDGVRRIDLQDRRRRRHLLPRRAQDARQVAADVVLIGY